MFHCTCILWQKINQILFAEYWYTFIFANIGHISLCLRCVIVTRYWNLFTVYDCFYPYLYEFALYRNLYAFIRICKQSIYEREIATHGYSSYVSIRTVICTKFIRNCTFLNVPDCDYICGYMTYWFLFVFEQMLSIGIIYLYFYSVSILKFVLYHNLAL